KFFCGKRGTGVKKEKRGQKQEGLWKLTPLMEIRPEHGFPQRLGKHKTLPTVSTRPYGDDETSILNCKADISHATKSGHLHVLTTEKSEFNWPWKGSLRPLACAQVAPAARAGCRRHHRRGHRRGNKVIPEQGVIPSATLTSVPGC